MSVIGSYHAERETGGLDQELARLRAQALISWPQELRMLQWLGLRDGMRVLELGSGPGYVTRELLHALPSVHIIAVESDRAMTRRARSYLRDADGADRVDQVESAVGRAGVRDGQGDFAIARYLFQHLTDPVTAAVDALRMLRPGGTLAVIDMDAELWGISQPVDPRLTPIHRKAARRQTSGGGDRAVGRRLWRILREAGFEDLRLEAFVYHSDEIGLEPFHPQLDPARLLPALADGFITRAEYEMVESAYRRFRQTPGAFVLMAGLIACGTKPG